MGLEFGREVFNHPISDPERVLCGGAFSTISTSPRENDGRFVLVTSDHVLIETWYLASSRLGADTAENLINSIRTGIARVESATLADLELAASTREGFPDQQFSIVDRTSWSVMQRLGVQGAIAFDRDYSIYRFSRNRRSAFTVHNWASHADEHGLAGARR